MMKKIKFLGAAGSVTGSGYFLFDESGRGIVIDLGMFQGAEALDRLNFEPLIINVHAIDAVIVTHAHLDHCGRLPLLVNHGYTGKIYCTQATRALLEITLYDAAKVAQEHSGGEVLYSEADVAQVLKQIMSIEYNREYQMGQFGVVLIDAGHILGSASVEVWDNRNLSGVRKIVFSGDLGNSPEELVRPTQKIETADVVIMESTYGDRTHAVEDADQVLTEEIEAVGKSGGTLLIPAFSLERTQEILHKIDHLKKKHEVEESIPIFLDSPMAIKATTIYKKFRDLYNDELKNHALVDDPFDFPGLHLVETHEESKNIKQFVGPKVIIAGSGMMTGGRILYHAVDFLPLETTRLLIVGFQAEGTLGRLILEGAETVIINDVEVPVKAHIRKSSGMSAHADQPKLLRWLSSIAHVQHVFLVHGEDGPRKILAEKIRSGLSLANVELPQRNDVVELG